MKGISIKKTRNWLLILQATSLESWLRSFKGVWHPKGAESSVGEWLLCTPDDQASVFSKTDRPTNKVNTNVI